MKLAAIQMTSGELMDDNIAALAPLVAQAAAQGAQFIATPENTFYMRRESAAPAPDVAMAQHAGLHAAQQMAQAHGVWLLIGSIRALEPGDTRPYNRSVLLNPQGEIAAIYDKWHLFDVTLPDGARYAESAQARPGEGLALAAAGALTFGLSICYDLRFPLLYRRLALAGATVLCVPSAFTRPTGVAHWQVLLRARAIENACYVLAPAQCGTHPGGRQTYGHSLIVDPWGRVLAEATDPQPGVIVAEADPAILAQVRAQIPVLAHHREA